MSGYDIIGDIHGQAGKLVCLLERLGYRRIGDVYRHPTRTALFLGDFIDRGPGQRAVLSIVMPMVAAGAARAVMGNHELNAIGYHTPHPEGDWLRPRTPKNTRQHEAFLAEYHRPGMARELDAALDFFRSLPLFIEHDALRAVHACWHQPSLDAIRPYLDEAQRLREDQLVEVFRAGSVACDAAEILLKGLEASLPGGAAYLDKDGHRRTQTRTRWWQAHCATLADAAFLPGETPPELEGLPAPEGATCGYPLDEAPVFIGHYWLTGEQRPLTRNVACLDYSAGKGGPLVAYRHRGERELSPDGFVATF